MKIDRPRISGAPGVQRLDLVRPYGPTERSGRASGARPADEVLLSARTLQASELQPLLGSLPAVREAQIQQLKEQIARGEYQVEPHLLAGRLLQAKVITE